MANKNFFDASYVGADATAQPVVERSEVKRLLKEATSEEEMSRYGSSKPKRIVIKGKIVDAKS